MLFLNFNTFFFGKINLIFLYFENLYTYFFSWNRTLNTPLESDKKKKEFTTEILNWSKHFNLKPYQNWVPNDIDNYVEPS